MPNGYHEHDSMPYPNLVQQAQDAMRQIKELGQTVQQQAATIRQLKLENDGLRTAIRSLKENPPNVKR
jgi:phage shock protein A